LNKDLEQGFLREGRNPAEAKIHIGDVAVCEEGLTRLEGMTNLYRILSGENSSKKVRTER